METGEGQKNMTSVVNSANEIENDSVSPYLKDVDIFGYLLFHPNNVPLPKRK